MPSFTTRVSDLASSGPVLQLSVGPSREFILAMGSLSRDLGPPLRVAAVVDTGAQTTVINQDVVKRLKLKPVGSAYINTPTTTTPVQCNRYHINVYFPDDFVVENIFAVEAAMGGQPYQCLMGRDILRLGELQYRGFMNEFSLIFGDSQAS